MSQTAESFGIRYSKKRPLRGKDEGERNITGNTSFSYGGAENTKYKSDSTGRWASRPRRVGTLRNDR